MRQPTYLKSIFIPQQTKRQKQYETEMIRLVNQFDFFRAIIITTNIGLRINIVQYGDCCRSTAANQSAKPPETIGQRPADGQRVQQRRRSI